MSDQDFFFDEEETTVTGAKETVKPSAKSESKPEPAARKSAPKPASTKPAPAKPAGGSSPFFEQSVSLTIASLMAVIGLLVGVIIGFLVAPDGGTVSTGTPAATTGTDAAAPQLSEEELSSGALPEGHPDIGSMSTTATTGE